MNKNLRWRAVAILAVVAISIWGFYPPQKKVRLGLDLQGGVHLVLRVQTDDALRLDTETTMEQLREVAEGKGLAALTFSPVDSTRFRVEGVPQAQDAVFREAATEIEASYNRVMVPIPVHIWEVIRRYPGIDLSYANKTDDELRDYVEHEVDERIREYEKASERAKGIASLSGSLVFGAADEPREQQIAAGIEYFTKAREHQRQVKDAIAKLPPEAQGVDARYQSYLPRLIEKIIGGL